jgi:hypothetical protein
MGIADMFGVRVEKLNLKENYPTMKDLYEKIKDVNFEAGVPSLVKHGFTWMIVFPQLDRNNQVQILGVNGKYSVQRSTQPAGVDKMMANFALDKLTNGITGLSGAFGDTKKLCMELATKTAATINALGL